MLAFTPTTNTQRIQARRKTLASLYSKFSDTGKGYRSLNITLANFQGSLHIGVMENLKHIHLERPHSDPLELFALLNAVMISRNLHKELNPLWQRAQRAQIEKAMSTLMPPAINCNDRVNLLTFVIKVLDFEPPNYRGGIVGLAERVKETWQATDRERRTQKAQALGLDTKLPAPVTRFAKQIVKGVTLVTTIGQLLDVGLETKLCTMDYAEEALRGDMVFYLLEKDGSRAVCAIKGEEYICDGEGHVPNAASVWEWWKP